MAGLARAALIRAAVGALALADGEDLGMKARTVLVKAVPFTAAGAVAGLGWRIAGAPEWTSSLIQLLGAAAATGTVVATIRRTATDPESGLLDALLATSPRPRGLRLLREAAGPEATQSAVPAPRNPAV